MNAMQAISLFLILVSVIVIVLGIVKVHTYPGVVAKRLGHPQAQAIEVTSLLGLLVFPLWMFALIWAYGGVIGVPLDRLPTEPDSDEGAPDGDETGEDATSPETA